RDQAARLEVERAVARPRIGITVLDADPRELEAGGGRPGDPALVLAPCRREDLVEQRLGALGASGFGHVFHSIPAPTRWVSLARCTGCRAARRSTRSGATARSCCAARSTATRSPRWVRTSTR